jgi:hypothetical protein
MDWQPIETAPKDGTVIDLWDRYGFRWTNRHWGHHSFLHGKPTDEPSWGAPTTDGPGPDPSHWMPLPEPPEC